MKDRHGKARARGMQVWPLDPPTYTGEIEIIQVVRLTWTKMHGALRKPEENVACGNERRAEKWGSWTTHIDNCCLSIHTPIMPVNYMVMFQALFSCRSF